MILIKRIILRIYKMRSLPVAKQSTEKTHEHNLF